MMSKILLNTILTSTILLCQVIAHADSNQKASNSNLTFVVPVKINNLDPILTNNAHSKFTLPLIYEPLIMINAEQELKPVLAKSWKIENDGKKVTINIHPKHRFTDGSEVTANDIKHSIKRLCSLQSQESGELSGLVGCGTHKPKMKVIDTYTISFDIKSSPTTFLYQLSSPSSTIAKPTNQHLIGSGPYMIESISNKTATLSRNPYYTGKQTPKNNGVTFVYAGDMDIIDSMHRIQPDGAISYRMQDISHFRSPNYKLIQSNPNITEIIVLNNQRYPFNIPLVRKALSTEIYNNFNYSCIPGSHKAYGVIPSGTGGSIVNIAPKTMPNITPKQVFLQAPSLKHQHTSITLHQLSDLKNTCEAEQLIKAAKKYHIDINFKYHKDYSTLLPLYKNHKLDGFIDLYVFKSREAYKIFQFFTQQGENDANIADNNIDYILSQATAMPSSHGRFQLYRKLSQYMQDKNIIIPLLYMDHGNLMSKCLSGISDDFFFNPFTRIPQLQKIENCTNQRGSST